MIGRTHRIITADRKYVLFLMRQRYVIPVTPQIARGRHIANAKNKCSSFIIYQQNVHADGAFVAALDVASDGPCPACCSEGPFVSLCLHAAQSTRRPAISMKMGASRQEEAESAIRLEPQAGHFAVLNTGMLRMKAKARMGAATHGDRVKRLTSMPTTNAASCILAHIRHCSVTFACSICGLRTTPLRREL